MIGRSGDHGVARHRDAVGERTLRTVLGFVRHKARPDLLWAMRGRDPTRAGDDHRLYAFLTCAANDRVRPVHLKAMPAILTNPQKWDVWLRAPADEALALQRPLPANMLRILAIGERRDKAA